MTGVYLAMITFDQRMLPMLMNRQVTVSAKQKVSYGVIEGMDVAAEPGGNV